MWDILKTNHMIYRVIVYRLLLLLMPNEEMRFVNRGCTTRYILLQVYEQAKIEG